jgi:excisionase family DNA binding protein
MPGDPMSHKDGAAMHAEHRLSVRETARCLGVHENTVRNWEERGVIRAIKLPGSGYRRFDVAEVERLQSQMTTTTGTSG